MATAVLALGIYGETLVWHRGRYLFFRQPIKFVADCFLLLCETVIFTSITEQTLFIIVNNGTVSAAEAFAYSLQSKGRAKIIGQPSAGAANMNSWYVVNEQIFVSISTAAPTLPGTEVSWEQTGIQPDHIVENDTEIEFIQKLLSNADR